MPAAPDRGGGTPMARLTRMRPPKRARGLALSAASGALLFSAHEPLALAPLAWVALVPLFVALFGERRWRWAFAYGSACGVAFFGAHLSWIFRFGWMAWTGLVVVLSLYLGGAAVVGSIVRRWPLAPVLAAGGWVGFELLRGRWPFGGFPWGAVGTSQGPVPGVRWLAGVVGAYGLSFLAAFVAAVVADRIVAGRWATGSLVLVGVVLLLFVGVDLWRYGSPPPGRPVEVAIVQGNVPRPVRPDQRAEIVRNHLELTRRLAPGEVDVVVWPEDAVGSGAPPDSLDAVSAQADRLGASLLVGHSEVNPEAETFDNFVVHFGPDGRRRGDYLKQHPVPFGEYVPLAFLRDHVTTLDQVPYDLARGDRSVVFDLGVARVATPICFESVFPRDVRAFAREGAELHVVATNDASFGRTAASAQHLAHARLRSLELRQWTVQAALSGITAVVAPDGAVSHRTELYAPELVRATMYARPAHSLYAKVGDLFSWGWTGGTLVALALYAASLGGARLRRRTSG